MPDVHVELDRPRDALLVGRAEMITGWIAPAHADLEPTASCGGRTLLLRRCFHPVMLERPDACGFWGYLFAQELLDEAHDGRLAIELRGDGRHLGTLHLRLTPSARLLATDFPLDLARYDVPPADAAAPADVVVFPGAGGVGGASINEAMRVQMLRSERDVPVHFEADQTALWRRVPAEQRARYRWIDGHSCHHAGAGPGRARFTMLREPALRMLSVFDYGQLVHPEEFAFASFDDFVASPDAWRTTQAVTLLRCAGVADADRLPRDEVLERAALELETSYALVGITELFEESLLLLCRLAGLDSIGMWWRVLAAPRSVAFERLGERTRARLEDLVAVDRALHAAAGRRLRALVADARLGDALDRYRTAAARERALPDILKQLECLRWRQTIAAPAATSGGRRGA